MNIDNLQQAKFYLDALGISGEEMHAFQIFLMIEEHVADPENDDNSSPIGEVIEKEKDCYLEDGTGADLFELVQEIAELRNA